MPPGRPSAVATTLLLGACASLPPAPAAAVAPALQPFLGRHAGELRMHHGGRLRTVPMRLLVEPVAGTATTVRFCIGYGEGGSAEERDYLLVLDDAATGACHVDERNGILLSSWLRDGELVSAFTVQGQTNVTRWRPTPHGIDFALEALATADGPTTGDAVRTHPALASQRATLRRLP